MSWHDPARSNEPEEDSALRSELRGLLGLPARAANYFETEPSPELIRLADDLRREAQRRNRTARQRNSWMLLAAAVPFTLALGGLGAWGLAEKHQLDLLSAKVAQEEAELQRLAAVRQAQPPQAPAGAPQVQPPSLAAAKGRPPQVLLVGKSTPKPRPKELVEPVVPAERNPTDTLRVNAH
jgi:hypothetical protein